MAISGTTQFQYAINTEIIDPLILDYLYGATYLPSIVRSHDMTGQSSLTYKFASHGALTAAATSQGTDLTPAALTMASDGTVTCAEVGVAVEASRIGLVATGGRVSEDDIARQIAYAIGAKMETDIAATFASFTTEVGSTGVDFSLANFEDALLQLRVAKAPAGPVANFNLPAQWAGYQCVLHEVQFADFLRALRVANVSDAFLPPDRAGLVADAGSKAASDLRGVYMGVKIYASTYPALVNSSADRSGAMFSPAAIGFCTHGAPQVRSQPWELGRSTYIVGSAIYGTSAIKVPFGVEIITDA